MVVILSLEDLFVTLLATNDSMWNER